MSIYFASSLVQSKHYKGADKFSRPANANNTIPYTPNMPNMPNGFPAFPQSHSTEKPPTLFHPASPKLKITKTEKEVDSVSVMSTSTFASTVSLLKENVKAKLHSKKSSPKKNEDKRQQNKPSMTHVWEAMALTK